MVGSQRSRLGAHDRQMSCSPLVMRPISIESSGSDGSPRPFRRRDRNVGATRWPAQGASRHIARQGCPLAGNVAGVNKDEPAIGRGHQQRVPLPNIENCDPNGLRSRRTVRGQCEGDRQRQRFMVVTEGQLSGGNGSSPYLRSAPVRHLSVRGQKPTDRNGQYATRIGRRIVSSERIPSSCERCSANSHAVVSNTDTYEVRAGDLTC